mmetsp:Transcript_55246/g.62719  ORF Transcript_55246/g.62719 Transcript_55246/m.62719 type:complete len:91 (+) Transcript_55246:84-356(+)
MGAVTVLEKAPDSAPAIAFLNALLLLLLLLRLEVGASSSSSSSFDEDPDSEDGLVTTIILSPARKDGVGAVLVVVVVAIIYSLWMLPLLW